ncbi:AI-2E family transporter [Geotoga petraea]|uniref:Predicted PurR-regulated permease PerM n=1 Tax=Geotoga petraea TaxID=28234 RepID=A0A1G6K477_9BACT|nr:AI-2E family transporter [Geotoga petraea]SDC25829.1 Predicted PurR-regulated permease PerM [Geotoga petraea]
MDKRIIAGIFSIVYISLFFLVGVFSMSVFSTIVFSIGMVLVVQLFSKNLIKLFKIPQNLSISLSLIIIFTGLAFLMFFLVPMVFGEVRNFVIFINNFFENRTWESLFEGSSGILGTESNVFPEIEKNFSEYLASLQPKIIEFFNQWIVELPNIGQKLGSFVFFHILITIYLSFYFDSFKTNIHKIYPRNTRKIAVNFLKDLHINLNNFVISTIFASLFVGVGAFIALNFLDIRYSLLLSFWAGITNFIPIVGVVFEFIPLIIVGISSGLVKMLILLIIMSILHGAAFVFFLNIMKGRARINPVGVILSILIFGAAFGFIGSLIAAPSALVIKVFWNHYVQPQLDK